MTTLGNYPFSKGDDRAETLAHCGESRLIEHLKAWLADVSPPSPEGIGDDCALVDLPAGQRQILTTDNVTWGQHIDERVSPTQAGAKLIKRNLSDIAAMGGIPGPALLTLLCGPNITLPWLEAFVCGIRETCLRYGVTIVGGDVSELAPGHFSAGLAQTGYVGAHYKLRSTASIGDHIYVTGQLGGSILGKHHAFEPRLREGRWLAGRAECTAMMDLTDGLGKDLNAVLPTGSTAALHPDRLPIDPAAVELAKTSGKAALEHAFSDGEDYELLFCCAGSCDRSVFEQDWRTAFPDLAVHQIGTIVADTGARYIDATSGSPITFQNGFQHFLPR